MISLSKIHYGSKKAVTFSKAQASRNSSFVILNLLSFTTNINEVRFMLFHFSLVLFFLLLVVTFK